MTDYLRLRQICVVTHDLERVVDDVRQIFGVEVCHRDPQLSAFGLKNALFPFGSSFLEIVAPIRDDTAAGRFLDRSQGRGGYMVIFDCSDAPRRRAHAERLGIRIANVMPFEEDGFYGVQLHPSDCRAAMIEFEQTRGGADLAGPYYPAGPYWRNPVTVHSTPVLAEACIESPEPAEIAQHWSKIIEMSLHPLADDGFAMAFELGALRFTKAPAGGRECLAALKVLVADPEAVQATAAARGCLLEPNGFILAGVRFEPVPHS